MTCTAVVYTSATLSLALVETLVHLPSVVVPMEFNYVLNPKHPDFARVVVATPLPFPFDPRLPLP